MTDFITNTKAKLSYAYAPKVYELASSLTEEITTDNTVTTLATHSANTFKAADYIRIAYSLTNINASANSEDFTYTLNLGGEEFVQLLATANGETDQVVIQAQLTRINDSTFFAEVTFRHFPDEVITDEVTYSTFALVTDSDVTGVTITAENDTVVATGLDLSGLGGYILVDSFETN
jgi:hypothetical protein